MNKKIMSFILNSCSNQGRSGILKLNGLEYKTPLIFQYSMNGSIPHLDWNLCQHHLNDDNAPLLIPLSTCIGMVPYLRSLQIDMHKFCCIPSSRASFVSVYDPLKQSPTGFNCKAGISIWTSAGRTPVPARDFIEVVNLLKPDGYQSLCDSDTPVDASKKRIDHSVKRTIGYLDEVIAQRSESSTVLLGSVEGGNDLKSRMISLNLTKERPVNGFVMESVSDQLKDNLDVQKIVKVIVEAIPEDKLRAVFGCLRPEEIHLLIQMGFDLFDSSYATFLAEDGKALLIELENSVTTSSILDLKESIFKEDFSIISKDCKCYSCQKGFTKGYLNHLLNCKEMSATVLLMLHNLHVLYEWLNKLNIGCH